MPSDWQDSAAVERILPQAGLVHDPVRRQRSDGIDLLRAILALWVVLAHLVSWVVAAQGSASVPRWLVAGMALMQGLFQQHGELHPAVLGFIVLSGYCIHRSGLRLRAPGELAGYAIRRCFRIAPLYYLGIAAGLVGLAIASHHSRLLAASLSGTDEVSSLCIAVKALVSAALYPAVYRCGFLGNAPLATVMVEIVLYILYAVAFAALVWQGRERVVWLVCGAVFLVSLGLFARGVDPSFYDWWQNGSVFGFLPYWWLGVVFVDPRSARAIAGKLWLVVTAWVVLTAVLSLGATPAPQAIAETRKLVFALGLGVLICAIDNAHLVGFGAVALVGRAGYGIYALHAPLTYALVIYGMPWWAVAVSNVIVGVGVHLTIERPLTDLGRRLRYRLAGRCAATDLVRGQRPYRGASGPPFALVTENGSRKVGGITKAWTGNR